MKKLFAFFGTLFTILMATGLAMAAEGAAAGGDAQVKAAAAIAAGVAVAIAAFGAALGQGRVGAAESIGRNPNAAEKLFLPLVLTLALLEALALYGFVIAIILQGKI